MGSFSVIGAIQQERQSDESPTVTTEKLIYCVLCSVIKVLKIWDGPERCDLLEEGLGSDIRPCSTAKKKKFLIDRILCLVLKGIRWWRQLGACY